MKVLVYPASCEKIFSRRMPKMMDGAALTSMICLIVFAVILCIGILVFIKEVRALHPNWIPPVVLVLVGIIGTVVSAIAYSGDVKAGKEST